jgi:nucleotide-binding universal stress UspA family protein
VLWLDKTPKEAVRFASRVAADMDCRLELVHVEKGSLLRSRSERSRRGHELLTEMLCEVPASVDAEVHLRRGEPAEALVEACDELGAAILFVGSSERRAWSVLRKRTHRLLAYGAECPLIIVPRGLARSSLDSGASGAVVCGVSEELDSVKVISLAVDLAERLQRRLVLVHSGEGRSLALTQALAGLPGSGVKAVEANPSPEGLHEVARAYNADFVMGGPDARGVPGNFSASSPAPQLVAHGEHPVVVLPDCASRGRREKVSRPTRALPSAATMLEAAPGLANARPPAA